MSLKTPTLHLHGYSNNEVIKITNDKDFHVVFETNKPEYEYELWTDWSIGKMHRIPVTHTAGNMFEVVLPGDNTGFFTITIRYKRPRSFRFTKTNVQLEVHVDPDWVHDSIVYNIFLRAFGAKEPIPGEGGTFEDVINHMDTIVDLGVNCIYLNPFHVIGDLYRKYNPNDHLPYYLQPGSPYSIKDYKSIDPELAFNQKDEGMLLADPKKQFKKLVDAAHRRGIRVIMDLVFNHTSHDFILQKMYPEWYLYKEDITSLDSPYLYPEDVELGKPWGDPKHTLVPYDHGTFSWTDVAQLNWEYYLPPGPNDPPKNTKKNEMYKYFKSVPKYWVKEFGIDGFRCDMAYHVPPDFWKECISETKEIGKKSFPANGSIDGEVIFIAESYVDDLKLLFESGFSLAYGDYSNKIYTPLNLKGYLDYMYNVGTHDFPRGSKWFIFPECHDFNRLTSKLMPLHDYDNEAAMRGSASRWVLTATLPGMPMVFNGFEKVEWAQVEHVSYSTINWNSNHDIRGLIKRINSIRKSNVALSKGNYKYVQTREGLDDSTQIFSYARYTNDEVIIIVINFDIHHQQGTELILQKIGHFDPEKQYILKDLISGKIFSRNSTRLPVLLGPGGSHIFKVEQDWGE